MSTTQIQNMLDTSLIEIVYEDDDLVVINKPAGLVVNEATTVSGMTVQGWWNARLNIVALNNATSDKDWQAQVPPEFDDQYGTPIEIFTQRSGIVHRLDKETSGALLLAKHAGSLVNLLAQFRLRQVEKTYTALVHGKVAVQKSRLDFPIARNKRNRQKMCVHPEGRSAITVYQVEQEYHIPAEYLGSSSEVACSLVRCWPHTGRMHQIRVHFAHINHPLVSDSVYLGRKRIKADLLWCPRHFLHASRIEFLHPRSKQKIGVDAPLPADLQAALSKLETVV